MRTLRSIRSTLLALASATLLLASRATPIHAAPGPDAVAIAVAYGQLSVFILDVAAGNDGRPHDPAGESEFIDAFARQVLSVYPSISVEQQQALAELPGVRDELQQLWPTLPVAQRRQIQRAWAAAVEDGLASVRCDVYDALARAYLLPGGPYKEANLDRLVQCWNAYPELAWSRDGRNLAAERAQRQAGGGSDQAYVALMNAETTSYAGTMNMISIMSGSGDRWYVK
jgi:hypothetical protein